jgi:hypothetical protein
MSFLGGGNKSVTSRGFGITIIIILWAFLEEWYDVWKEV